MAHCLSRFPISHPFSFSINHHNPKYSHYSYSVPNSGRDGNNTVKVMAVDERHNLDHLQRQNKHQSPQLKKRSPQVAPVGLWDRFPTARTVQQMMETMDRIKEDPVAFDGGWVAGPSTEEVGYRRGRTPWEIKESEGEYKMRFDMPEDVKVWVEETLLVVKAEKVAKNNKEEEEEEWSAKSYGKYSTRIALPENVDFEKIKAEVRDGVLYITIPKASSNPKFFDINVE
ncbi:small heat shock protein, chloroplastic-like isoform X1 [Lycium barbarum]|uniref:small heat shock protein, chloroplastic-like isoform X1 n=1 Tax=Lycium barbarum TaxID=112863 RepID=UPI00293EDB63|nr:small heat shock protein, chloroplastic-like isoform X1 [Lycium barbarum]